MILSYLSHSNETDCPTTRIDLVDQDGTKYPSYDTIWVSNNGEPLLNLINLDANDPIIHISPSLITQDQELKFRIMFTSAGLVVSHSK